jgi:uncharacterized protein
MSESPVKRFATQQPLLFALLLTIISIALLRGIPLLCSPLKSMYATNIIVLLVQLLFAVGMLLWLGWTRRAGFNAPSQWRNLSLLWLPALLAVLDLGQLVFFRASSFALFLYALLYALLTAANEEAFSRGLTLQTLLPYGPLRATLLSAALFGLLHLNNLFLLGFTPFVFIQAIGAFFLGIGFAAYRLRTTTLWPLILIHMCYDLATDVSYFASPKSSTAHAALPLSLPVLAIALLVPSLLQAIYGLYLLRPRKQREELRAALQ